MMRDDSSHAGNRSSSSSSQRELPEANVRVFQLRARRADAALSSSRPSLADPGELLAFDRHHEARKASNEEQAFKRKILVMDKLALLEEMIRFQEERSSRGHLTLAMILKGRHLFKALEQHAETQELQILTSSYRKHLEFEYEAYVSGKGTYLRTRTLLEGVDESLDD